MNILLLGPHGAGKSTQAHLLSAELHIPYISTGEMLRTLASQQNDTGQQIRRRLERGEYMTDQEMIPLVDERLTQVDTKHGFILEGYPRTLAQVRALKAPINLALNIHLSRQQSIDRLMARQRPDDTSDSITRRLDHHQQEAAQILEHFQQAGILCQVDGSQDIPQVQAALLAEIKLHQAGGFHEDRTQNA